jgi:hypothetical protein
MQQYVITLFNVILAIAHVVIPAEGEAGTSYSMLYACVTAGL